MGNWPIFETLVLNTLCFLGETVKTDIIIYQNFKTKLKSKLNEDRSTYMCKPDNGLTRISL